MRILVVVMTEMTEQRSAFPPTEKRAEEHLALLDEQVDDSGAKIYSEERKMRQRKAIMATVPVYNSQLGTVVQPNLTKNATVVEFAVAAADLAGCSMDGPKQFIYEGNAIFREDVLAIKVNQNNDYLSES